ncbi:MAG: FMN-binding protein [Clostridiales bacterium]|nr:FMN-binding protein [Clostridiales bacterium]
MKDNRLKGIIALAVVTIIAFGVIYGSKILVKDEAANDSDKEQIVEDLPGAIDVADSEGIVSAREITDDSGAVTAYSVVSEARGFAPKPITWEIVFENDAKTIREVKVVSHAETPGYGANMEEASYLDKYKGISATETSEIDGISGATVTTDAIRLLVNNAYEFISSYAGN